MLVNEVILSKLEILIQYILTNYLLNSYCTIFVTDTDVQNFNILHEPFIHIKNINDTKLLGTRLLRASELGCSDYIVHVHNPEIFVTLFEENIHAGNQRRPDRKLIFLPVSLKQTHVQHMLGILNLVPIQYVPNVLVVLPACINEWSCDTFQLVTHQYGGVGDNSAPVVLDVWDCNNSNLRKGMNLFPNNMMNLMGKTLRLAVFMYKPYVLLDLDTAEFPGGYDGTEVRMAIEFCKWLNCTIEIVRDDAGQWGEIYDNRTGIGVIGNVAMDLADIGLTALYSWYHEYKFLDLSMPGVRTGVTCIAPAPTLLPGWKLPFLPFSPWTWAGIALTIMLSSFGLYLARNCTSSNTILASFGVLMLQPTGLVDEVHSTRCVLGWVFLASLVLGNAYSGGLASVMTVPKYEKSIDTVQELVDSGIEWGATHDAWIFSILLSDEPDMVHLVKKFKLLKSDELKAKGKTRKFAFSIERLPAGHYAIGDYVTEEVLPYLQLMVEDIYWEQCLMMARKSSPYTKLFNRLLGRLHSSGLLDAWETQVVLRHSNFKVQLGVKLSQTRHLDFELRSLDFQHVLGAFILLGLGVLTSTAVFVFEFLKGNKNLLIKYKPKSKYVRDPSFRQ